MAKAILELHLNIYVLYPVYSDSIAV